MSVTGTVTGFDESRGRGEITAADGTRYEFHATRIADGSRRIAVGVAVTFVTAPAPNGRYEAAQIAPVQAV